MQENKERAEQQKRSVYVLLCNVLSNSHCDICSVFSLFYVTKLTFTSVYVSSARRKHLFRFDIWPMQLIVMAQQHVLERLRQLPILFLLRNSMFTNISES